MQNILLGLILILFSTSTTIAQIGHEINIEIEGYENDTLIVGYFYGKSQRVVDTLFAEKPGQFLLKGADTLTQGMYLALIKPNHNYFQFMIGNDQKFNLETNFDNLGDVKTIGAEENKIFYQYLNFLSSKNKEVEAINLKYPNRKLEKDSLNRLEGMLVINKDVETEQNRIINQLSNSQTALLIKLDKKLEFPEFEGTLDEIKKYKYLYYRSHYFDHIDLSDDRNLYTPGFDKKLMDFINKWTPNHPDSLIVAIDDLLPKMEKAKDMYKYYLSSFLNNYGKSRIVGQDAIYVHLANNYYGKGKAYWADKKIVRKIKKEARLMEPSLIGKTAANIKLFKEDSTSLMLHDIDSKYTILFFWSPTCGHCKKSMPNVIKAQEEYASKGVRVVSICTKHNEDYKSCWEGVKKENMENFLNLGDEFHKSRFKLKFNVRQTPKVFVLDADKKILIKDFPAEKMDEVMKAIIEEDNKNFK